MWLVGSVHEGDDGAQEIELLNCNPKKKKRRRRKMREKGGRGMILPGFGQAHTGFILHF
jgi:hypothetical protein